MTYRSQKGFTLVEALVSLMILSIGIVPAYSLTRASQNIANRIRDNVVAANLAQEGAEVIHAIRDTNWFLQQPFNNGLNAGNYEVEWNSELPLTAYQNRPLRVDGNGRYGYASGTETSFYRRIRIFVVSPQELKVLSEVQWNERTQPRSVQVESHLFNWR